MHVQDASTSTASDQSSATVTWINAGDPRWSEVECALAKQHLPLALDGREAWLSSQAGRSARLLAICSASGEWIGAATLDATRSRVLPGHTLLRARRFGHGLPQSAWQPAIAALKQAASQRSTLRLNVEVFSPHHREELGSLLQQAGFHRAPQPSSYRHTLTMDLAPTEAELLSTRSSLRKRLREADKSGAVVRALGPLYAPRLLDLQQQAMQRSGGTFRVQDWPRVLAFSQTSPHLSRAVGLFVDPARADAESLVGFAWACHHGDHAEYRAGGTAQGSSRLPISHPLLWDLVLWARNSGASWFDLGGVTIAGATEDADPLAGISDFKRNFSKHLVEVGEEWTLVPNPARAALAAKLGSAADIARAALKKLRTKPTA